MPVTMNYVSWFMVLYLIASYIRLYPKKLFSKTRLWGILTLVSIIFCVLSVLCCAWLSLKFHKNIWYFFVTDSNTLLAVFVGVCAFMFFKNINIKYNAFINAVASTTFGILMIHANCDAMRHFFVAGCLPKCQNVRITVYAINCDGLCMCCTLHMFFD